MHLHYNIGGLFVCKVPVYG